MEECDSEYEQTSKLSAFEGGRYGLSAFEGSEGSKSWSESGDDDEASRDEQRPEVQIDFVEKRPRLANISSYNISEDLEEIKAEGNIILGLNRMNNDKISSSRNSESSASNYEPSRKQYETP